MSDWNKKSTRDQTTITVIVHAEHYNNKIFSRSCDN